jgi:hypothetical protein
LPFSTQPRSAKKRRPAAIAPTCRSVPKKERRKLELLERERRRASSGPSAPPMRRGRREKGCFAALRCRSVGGEERQRGGAEGDKEEEPGRCAAVAEDFPEEVVRVGDRFTRLRKFVEAVEVLEVAGAAAEKEVIAKKCGAALPIFGAVLEREREAGSCAGADEADGDWPEEENRHQHEGGAPSAFAERAFFGQEGARGADRKRNHA